MTEIIFQPSETASFKDFLFKNRRNRTILILAGVAIVIQFSLFKYLYPYASFIHGDSFSYINAASKNLTISTYLIGYSKFIRLVSVLAKPDIVLVGLQYLFIQFSALFLLFTIFYFYLARKIVQAILLCFMVFNPLFLHLGNMVSSDGIFLALSMTWFALLLWIIQKPSNKIIIWHAVILFLAFIVRYNAMIYPFIAGLAFWISNLSLSKKIVGLGLGILLCGWFMILTMYQYKKLTGYWQYSPFSGWQLANNAMYAYRYVDSADRKPVPKEYQPLDKMIREYFDSTRDISKFPTEAIKASTYYMWSPGMPLMTYRNSLFKKANDTTAGELKKWATVGPLYKKYGLYIIKQYPGHFAQNFIWPNTLKYYAPPVEFLAFYNSEQDYVTQITQRWFGYKSQKVYTRMNGTKVWILKYYPVLSGTINVVMLFSLICFTLLKGWQINKIFNRILIMGSTIWLINAGFTIGASSAALRFQSFPLLLVTIFSLLLVDWMFQLMKSMEIAKHKQINLKDQFPDEAIA